MLQKKIEILAILSIIIILHNYFDDPNFFNKQNYFQICI